MSLRQLGRAGVATLAAGLALVVLAPAPVGAEPGAEDTAVAEPGAQQAARLPSFAQQNRVRMRVDALEPRVVTAQTRSILVRGQLRNTGDRPITNLRMRLQLGERLVGDDAMQTAMINPPETDVAVSEFVPVRRGLRPGALAPFEIRVPVGTGAGALPLSEQGVYPLLVNVNGTPEYGGQARIGSLDLLLPVREQPGGPPAAPNGRPPARLTMLWPLVDEQPRRVGTQGRFEVLSDDTLARSLAPGGRLYGLVNAANTVLRGNESLSGSVCFAIDPDLVRTATLMRQGYQVRDPRQPGRTVPGRGARAATDWLNRLNELVDGRCVLSLPYADADLVALARRGLPDLERAAVNSAGVLTAGLNRARPLPGVLWPAGGSLDPRTAADLAGGSNLILDPGAVGESTEPGPLPLERTGEGGQRAIRLDRLTSTALGGSSVERGKQAGVPMPTQTPLDTQSVAVQNGLAALLYRTQFAGQGENPSVLVAPPRRWQAPESELRTLLETARDLLANGAAVPASMDGLVNGAQASTPVSLNYPPAAAAVEVPRTATDRIAEDNAVRRDLISSMRRDPSRSEEPADVVAPVQQALLRAASSAWRGVRRDEAVAAAQNARNQLTGLTSLVSVERTNLPLTLASDDSRLRLTVRNRLPVQMTVRLKLLNANGLRMDRNIRTVLPGGASRSIDVPVRVLRSGRFTVDVALTTENGTPLGRPARLELSSTAYGTATIAVAGTAFVALLLLSGRRAYRRLRDGRSGQAPPPAPPAAAKGMGNTTGERL